jgi:cell division protein FtsQ
MRRYKPKRKLYKTKKKKSIFRNRIFWFAFLCLLFLAGISYLFLFFHFFQVKEIRISGNQKITVDNMESIINNEIGKKFLFLNTDSIFLVNLKKINRILLEKYPLLAQVNLKKEFPNILVVEAKERTPIGVWCRISSQFFPQTAEEHNNKCFSIDENGIAFEEIVPKDGLIIKSQVAPNSVALGQKVIEESLLKSILEIQKKLTSNLKIWITEFDILSSERLNVKTLQGWEIYFNPKENINWQIVELGLVLEKEIPIEKISSLEYIDLRFTKVYYKYKK